MSSKVIQIALVGDPFVGKSSLIRSYFNDEFSDVHMPALCDKEIFDLKVTEMSHKVKIHDTVKSTRMDFSAMDLIVVCYSIENRISYRNVKSKWIEEVLKDCDVPRVLVATKVDLRQEFPNTFFLTIDDGESLSREIGAVKYFETSSKENVNVKQLIEHSVDILFPKESKVAEKLKTFHEAQANEEQQERKQRVGRHEKSSCLCC